MNSLETFAQQFADTVWGTPLVILLLGGGLFFCFISRATPYRRFGHGVAVLLGRYDTPDATGEISHRQALAAALSNTMGLGNIAGVALAIVETSAKFCWFIWYFSSVSSSLASIP